MVKYAGFQPWRFRRRFGAFLPVFAFFISFVCALRADIIYLDDDGNVISTEKTEYDEHGNIVVVPDEQVKEEIVTPSRGAGKEELVSADSEHLDLKYGGISVVSEGGVDKVVFRIAPPNAVKLVIPDGVTDIDPSAFLNSPDLESVVFPNSVNFIPPNAFTYSENQKLKSVVLPAHVSIGTCAFYALNSLESVTVNKDSQAAAPPKEDAMIGDEAFGWCRNLKQFEFPEGIRSIGKDAFINCELLETVTVPDGVESIGERAFCQCYALKTLRLPDSVKTIGRYAFCNCKDLEDFKMPPGPIDFGDSAFGSCFAFKHFKFPPLSSTELPGILSNCRGLETVELPDGITAIGDRAFESCHELKEIKIPDGVKTIGYRAFASCPKLERVTLPASLKSLDSCAFGWCPALKEITIPEGVKEIAADAFRETPCWGSVRKLVETRHIKITYAE